MAYDALVLWRYGPVTDTSNVVSLGCTVFPLSKFQTSNRALPIHFFRMYRYRLFSKHGERLKSKSRLQSSLHVNTGMKILMLSAECSLQVFQNPDQGQCNVSKCLQLCASTGYIYRHVTHTVLTYVVRNRALPIHNHNSQINSFLF